MWVWDRPDRPRADSTFSDHSVHLDSWFDGVLSNDERVHLVLHDWGSALGFHWARRNAERVASITVMEGIVRVIENWDEFPESGRDIFQAMRTDNVGEKLVLEKNMFVEKILPASIMRTLEKDENGCVSCSFRSTRDSSSYICGLVRFPFEAKVHPMSLMS